MWQRTDISNKSHGKNTQLLWHREDEKSQEGFIYKTRREFPIVALKPGFNFLYYIPLLSPSSTALPQHVQVVYPKYFWAWNPSSAKLSGILVMEYIFSFKFFSCNSWTKRNHVPEMFALMSHFNLF